jgi:formate dehydrogenase (NADP+) beta subunit
MLKQIEGSLKGWQVPVDAAPTGKRVLVVGAGPSGLSAAYHLARLGHSVIIKLGSGQYEAD